jgi:hypothetical protein
MLEAEFEFEASHSDILVATLYGSTLVSIGILEKSPRWHKTPYSVNYNIWCIQNHRVDNPLLVTFLIATPYWCGMWWGVPQRTNTNGMEKRRQYKANTGQEAFHTSQPFFVVRLDWIGKCLIETQRLSTRLKRDARVIRDQSEQSFFLFMWPQRVFQLWWLLNST